MTDQRCVECGLLLPRDRCPVPGCPHRIPLLNLTNTPRSRAEAWTGYIERAIGFRVLRTLGGGKYEEFGVFSALSGARGAKRRAGRDQYGRPAMIYAIVPDRMSVFVE